jgi:acyl-CoA reductase-like NAD-dependent aldehyde dehydrogenase
VTDSRYTMTIDGRAVAASDTLEVVDPATGRPFTTCPDCSRAQLDEAVAAAARAFPAWRADQAGRRAALLRCAEAIEAQAEALAEVLSREQGKPLARATEEIFGAAVWFRATAALPLEDQVLKDDGTQRVELRRRPLGVVAGITPWNFPVLLAVWKIAPALLAGNSFVLKPSPFTPLSSLKLGEVLRDALPPGVFNVVSGGDELGRWLTEHEAVRKISFTGSVATGKKIAAAAAPDLKRVTLELGGNDPAIVLKDNDPKAIAEKVFWSAFANSGQVCVAVKRLYVEEEIYPEMVSALAEIARRVKVGPGLQADSELGPLNNRAQFDRVSELVDDARSQGARIEAGGTPLSNEGYFYAPTIVTGIAEGTRLVDEEQFGPALPVMSFRSVDEVLGRANDSHFGLGGSIWTRDLERGMALARELDCGTAWVNQHMNLAPDVPFGGVKWSGIGYENGPWGLAAFSEYQVVNAAL